MRKAASLILPVLAVALLAALAALWPLGALAGPPAQTVPGAPPDGGGQIAPDPAPARIQGLDFAAFPRSGDYTAGENIRVTVKFDHNVTVSGQPQLALDIGGQQRWAAYYHGSGARNLKFAYLVHPSDWDGNGVSVPAGSIALNGGSITSGSNVAATLSHSGIADDGSRKVQGSPDSSPSFGSAAISSQSYQKSAEITALTLPAATGGNGLLTYSLDLPAGLVFNAAARAISGKPTTTQNAVSYTYAVTDADGDTASLSFTITVDGAPTFGSDSTALPAQTYAKGAAIATRTFPAATDGNTPLTYSLTPALPDGLAFNAAARTISGKPTTTQNAAAYTYTVTDADGDTDTLSLAITVDGAPTFPGDSDTLEALTYTRGVAIATQTFPAAVDGNAPLTYSLSPAPPDGLVFSAAARTLSGAPTMGQAATSYTYTVTDADGDTDALSLTIAVTGDYDLDDDGLIEIDRLAQLDAVRWDLNGDGAVDTGTSVADTAKYSAAFAGASAGMGCLRDHDDDATTAKAAGCIGYELTQNLDFDTDGDGATYTTSSTGVVTGDDGDAYYNGGKGWTPIGHGFTNRFTATFDGNGNTISNLFIKDAGASTVGLFSAAGPGGGRIERLGLRNVNITGRDFVGGLVGYHSSAAISAIYVTGSITGNSQVGGLVGMKYLGAISASYSTASVTGDNRVGGLAGRNSGAAATASYATGAITGNDFVGGLAGVNYGVISASYATGSVTGSNRAGGLVGRNNGAGVINSSYATGSVSGASNVGGLVGFNMGAISASYATGSVTAATNVGGLVGSKPSDTSLGTATNSYWDTGTAGQTTSAGGAGKTTRDLQSPADYSGIYAAWNTNLDGVAGNDNPWDFGANRQYPALKYGGLDPAQQRQTAIRSDNWNAPVVGEPVVASLNVTGAAGITWQWQSSTNGSTWTDIASATGAAYVPVAADAASGGKLLRAKAAFTASGSSRTLTTVNTAKVVASAPATTAAATALRPVVGNKVQYGLSVTGAADHAWRWQRCDNAAMTTNCAYIAASDAATAEYTPVAGDVGKYLRAYAYYAANDVGKTWTRTETPILGPVAASPPASP